MFLTLHYTETTWTLLTRFITHAFLFSKCLEICTKFRSIPCPSSSLFFFSFASSCLLFHFLLSSFPLLFLLFSSSFTANYSAQRNSYPLSPLPSCVWSTSNYTQTKKLWYILKLQLLLTPKIWCYCMFVCFFTTKLKGKEMHALW